MSEDLALPGRTNPGGSGAPEAKPPIWRGGRVAEGGGLLNRDRVKSSVAGSTPPLSAYS